MNLKNEEEMEGRVQNDLWYLKNWTFSLDISIILKTIIRMIHGDKNAY
jgi:lipopolysaccharide/colanic/teichoic acid biosynthesis glycosyltransferase